ncbi:TPA: hypothetical protein OT304_000124 [Pseudomonas aeruginosa]|nr:hypothetical protein [Pseudomonas aeruginosa]
MQRVLIWGGVLITFFYVLLVAYLVHSQNIEMPEKLNEIGDFLAGIFGPITIVWLILGFIQQGMELRQNNDALKMQAAELKASVEQQTAMAESQRTSLDHYGKAMEPLLKLTAHDETIHDGNRYLNLSLQNLGEYCEQVSVRYSYLDYAKEVGSIFRDEVKYLLLDIDVDAECLIFQVDISYVNRLGVPGVQSFSGRQYFSEEGESFGIEKRPFLT